MPVVASPMPVVVADEPNITIGWSRIPGDNGSNTDYRLYVGDLSRDGPALDVLTKNNYYRAYLRAEGRRYALPAGVGSDSQRGSVSILRGAAGQAAPVLTGVTPGLFVDTSLSVTTSTLHQAIVRVCPQANESQCSPDSGAGWGPWSNTVTGTTSFTITP